MQNQPNNSLVINLSHNITDGSILKLAQSIFDEIDAADSTRTDYKYRIQKFLDFLPGNLFSHNVYLAYKRSLASDDSLAVATKNKYLAAARVFLKELNRKGTLPVDITQNVKAFKQDKKHKTEGVTEAEFDLILGYFRPTDGGLLNGADYPSEPMFRLQVIIALLAFQGLRQIEVCRLDVGDIDLKHMKAYVQGKGRDDKEPIYLHPETVAALTQYLDSYQYTDGPLLRSESNSSRGTRITSRGLYGIVTGLFEAYGIEGKTVHGFRHLFTTNLIKAFKGDLIEVSHYTRHRSLEMLTVYNDQLQTEKELPRYYGAFNGLSFR